MLLIKCQCTYLFIHIFGFIWCIRSHVSANVLTCHRNLFNHCVALPILVWLVSSYFVVLQQNKKYRVVHIMTCLGPNGKSDLETVRTISRWRFNLHTHWCVCHCWVLLLYMFSAVICFVCIPCKQLSLFPQTHPNWRGVETYPSVLCI
jgi:hypothetical protein